MLLLNDSVTTTPPFPFDRVRLSRVPRCLQYYEGAKTSCAEYDFTYGFVSPLQSLFPVRSLVVETASRARPVYSRAPSACLTGRTQDLPGSWGIHPCTFALFYDPGRSALASPSRPTQFCPHWLEDEDTSISVFRGSIARLQYLLSTLQVVRCRTRMQDSLPAGG